MPRASPTCTPLRACAQVLEDFQQRIALLQARPTLLDEFMAYQVMHTQQIADKKVILAHATQVDDMYDMLAAYEQKTNTNDQVRRACAWAWKQEMFFTPVGLHQCCRAFCHDKKRDYALAGTRRCEL